MAEEKKFSWRLGDIFTFIKNSAIAIVQGKLLLRLNVGSYFVHVLYTFFLLAMLILFSLGVESTLNKVEKNKAQLHEMEILYADKTFEVASMSRRSTVQKMLQDMGSTLAEPQQPANIIGK